MKTFSLLVFTLLAGTVMAQNKNLVKAEAAYKQKNWKAVLKLTNKVLASDVEKKNPVAHMLRSEALYNLYTYDEKYAVKNPGAFKDAVRSAIKSAQYDANGAVKKRHAAYLDKLAGENRKEADVNFAQERYPRALAMYKTSYDLTGDTLAYALVGQCYLLTGMTRDAISVFREVAAWNYGAFGDSAMPKTYSPLPFEGLAQFYHDTKELDSCRMYAGMGLDIFPLNKKLTALDYEMRVNEVNGMPLSAEYVNACAKALERYPADSFFTVKQNIVHLYLLRNAVANNDSVYLDTLVSAFVKEKTARDKGKFRTIYLKYDRFVLTDRVSILRALTDYYYEFGHKRAAVAMFYKWQKESGTYADPAKGFVAMAKAAAGAGEPALFVSSLLDRALLLKTQKAEAQSYRAQYFSSRIGQTPANAEYPDLIAMGEDISKNGGLKAPALKTHNELLKKARIGYVASCTQLRMYSAALKALQRYEELYPGTGEADEQRRQLAMDEFRRNFIGSAIPVSGEGSFKWNGLVSNCETGSTPEDVQRKVEARINYYRRAAGIYSDIVLEPQRNRWCQEAALWSEANNTLSHNPGEFTRCFTEDAATAAKLGLVVKGAHTVFAVNSMMADNGHENLGYRRLFLNPHGYLFGHGSTTNNAVVWVLDDNGSKDSSYYTNHFVSWPAAGYTPLYFMDKTKYWSFSMYREMKGATVAVLDENNNELQVKTFEPVSGYGMPTLVFQPVLTKELIHDEANFTVKINLADGSKISYRVVVLDIRP